MIGKDILSRFNFEEMTMMRELNFDMNEKLFHNQDKTFALAGSVSPMAFKGDTGSNAKYSLFNKRDGNTSIGLGVAFTDVRSDDEQDGNSRVESSYQLVLPMGYKMGNLNMITSPRIGYARGSYGSFDGRRDRSYGKRVDREKRHGGALCGCGLPILSSRPHSLARYEELQQDPTLSACQLCELLVQIPRLLLAERSVVRRQARRVASARPALSRNG
jgi:hypothetical protein